MTGGVLLGLDLGSTRVKALVCDRGGAELATGWVPTPWRVTATGAEADPDELYRAALAATRHALEQAPGGVVLGVGVTGMAEAVAVLGPDAAPVAPAIAWYDGRGVTEAAELAREVGPERFSGLTGLAISVLPTLVKLRWLRRNAEGVTRASSVLSLPEYVAWRLGGERSAERSLASRTGLFDVRAQVWVPELVEWAGLAASALPPARPAGAPLGVVREEPAGLERLHGAVVALGGHDHLCAAVGAGVLRPDAVLNSCGTAEAYVRSVSWLEPVAMAAAVRAGIGVGCHVLPGHQAILAGRPLGLVLGPVYELLGWQTEPTPPEEPTPPDGPGRAGAVPPGARRPVEWAGTGLAFAFDETTGRSCLSGIGPGVSPGRAKALAIDEVLRGSFELFDTVASLGAEVSRVVLTGGWAAVEPIGRRKAAAFPGATFCAVAEPAARGAALMAAWAAGIFSAPEEFPVPPPGPGSGR